MTDKKFILSFVGNKVELHRHLKMLCAGTEETMNTTIISLIEKHIKSNLGKAEQSKNQNKA